MTISRPFVLSIAGFDPSGGAGLLADIKTCEANEVYGLGVCTALTFQNDVLFERVNWVEPSEIIAQCSLLFDRFPIDFVKIGLIENVHQLPALIQWLKKANPAIHIIWDPVLRASAGYDFHQAHCEDLLKEIYQQISLLTPNIPEMTGLHPSASAEQSARAVSQYCPVYLKGGHLEPESNIHWVTDILFTSSTQYPFTGRRIEHGEKHGSGCVLSSAILSWLARGFDLPAACQRGKEYTATVLGSNSTLLGYHYQK